jgi:hypothetical protein
MIEGGRLSIWFFVGLMLTTYGVMIVGAGLYGLVRPPDVKLAYLHADLVWGAFLLAAGLGYLYVFNPKKHSSKPH